MESFGLIKTNETTALNSLGASQKCSLPLTVLDFIHNYTQPDLDLIWPCEARFYWISLQPFVRVVRFLLSYITPFIIILGVLLNTVSFGMLSTSVLSDTNLSIYLRALAISDNGALIFNYAVGIAKSHSTFVNDLFMNSRFLCNTNSVSMEFFQFTSAWLVVMLTWTRVVAVVSPFVTRSNRQNRSALISVTAVTCMSFVISLTKLYSGGYETDSVFEFKPCQKTIRPWGSVMYVYIALSTWLPLLFIFVGNSLLIVQTRKSDRIHNRLTRNLGSKTNLMNKTSRTLLAVSIVYLVLLLPLGIVETLELYWDVILIKFPNNNVQENRQYINWLKEKMLLKWCRGLFFHAYHWNFAINFFLYFLTGEKFRRIVIQTLKKYKTALLPTGPLKCISWFKCPMSLTPTRVPNILLIKVITLNEKSSDNNVTTRNGIDIATIS